MPNTTHTLFARLILAVALLLAATQSLPLRAQDATQPNQPTPEQMAARLKGKWIKAFEDARRDLQNINDRESAEFAGKVLASLKQAKGTSPAALAEQAARVKAQVRELVKKRALESAAILNWAQLQVLLQRGYVAEPADPKQKTGGKPGPGGLVLYLPFDAQDKDGVVRDASGAGNDGSVHGATWTSEGRFGGAYHFDITRLEDRIVIPNSDLLNPEVITISAWIRSNDKDGFWNRILDKHYSNGYCLSLGGDAKGKGGRGKLTFECTSGGLLSDTLVGDDLWHHVAGSYDGKELRLYVDGQEKSRTPKVSKPLSKNGWDLCIGNSLIDYGTGEFLAFDGLIDEVRIYNRTLSALEIKALATATQAGVELPTPAPLADKAQKPKAEERLKTLKSLFEQGLISKDDYEKKVKEVVAEL
jgi:hypothetical protein